MNCRFHTLVQRDVNGFLRHYETESGERLADEFFEELTGFLLRAAAEPTGFHFENHRLRRVNLRRFPINFLYELRPDYILVVVVRHNRRHPSYGVNRR